MTPAPGRATQIKWSPGNPGWFNAPHPDPFVAVGTFLFGTLMVVAKVHQQTTITSHSRYDSVRWPNRRNDSRMIDPQPNRRPRDQWVT